MMLRMQTKEWFAIDMIYRIQESGETSECRESRMVELWISNFPNSSRPRRFCGRHMEGIFSQRNYQEEVIGKTNACGDTTG